MVETTYATLEAKSLFIVKYTLLPEGISLPLATKEPLKGFLQSKCTALWFWEVPVAWASAQRIWPSLVSPGFTLPGALFAKSPLLYGGSKNILHVILEPLRAALFVLLIDVFIACPLKLFTKGILSFELLVACSAVDWPVRGK